jgi:hypothetical protein
LEKEKDEKSLEICSKKSSVFGAAGDGFAVEA